MKTRLLPFPALTLAAAGLAFLPAGRLAADVEPPHATAPAGTRLRLTQKDEYKHHGFDDLKGQAVRAADGKDLGHIRDLVLDSRTGEPRFVIVGGGGFAGMGGDSRLLPIDALIRDPNDKGFLTRLQRVDWDLLPVLDKDDIKDGRIVITTEQRQHLTQLHDQPWARSFEAIGEPGADPHLQRYVFASALAGKPLYGDDQKVGKVEDIYTDVDRGPAMAVVQIDSDYTGAGKDEYLVPIDALQAPAGEHGRVHTTLGAADFQQAAGISAPESDRERGRWVKLDRRARDRDDERVAHRDAAATPVEPVHDYRRQENVVDADRDRVRAATPVAATSGYADERVSTQRMETAARAVRDAWEDDAQLRRLNLTVTPQDDQLVLSGAAPSRVLLDRAEQAARHATSRVTIVNRIHVDEDAHR